MKKIIKEIDKIKIPCPCGKDFITKEDVIAGEQLIKNEKNKTLKDILRILTIPINIEECNCDNAYWIEHLRGEIEKIKAGGLKDA